MKSTKKMNVKISGTGIYLPENVYSNQDVIDRIRQAMPPGDPKAAKLDPNWIEQNIGIKARRWADCTREERPETAVNMATWALQDALSSAGWKAEELDAIILSSVSAISSDNFALIPSIACQVQHSVGAFNASAYDVLAACSGWTYAAAQAISQISSGMAKKVAVISCETQEKGLEFENPVSSVLIGDVAACTLFEESESENVLNVNIEANRDGDDWDIITLNSPNIWNHQYNGGETEARFRLKGKTVFKAGTKRMVDLAKKSMEAAGLSKDDIQHFVFHQANGAMLLMAGSKLGLSPTQVPINLDRLANTTSGTIPSVLHEIVSSGRVKKGDKIMFVSFGGGITSGSILMEY